MTGERGSRRLSTAELCGVLRDILSSVEAGDSYEGRIEYRAADDADVYEVVAAYRIGNSMGQGGMVLISADSTPESVPVAVDPW